MSCRSTTVLRMKRKHPISEEQRPCKQAIHSVRNLEKQYEELCRLREQVQIAESQMRAYLRDIPRDARR